VTGRVDSSTSFTGQHSGTEILSTTIATKNEQGFREFSQLYFLKFHTTALRMISLIIIDH
jgi:hypothetical protein